MEYLLTISYESFSKKNKQMLCFYFGMFSLSIFLAEVEEATRPLGAEDNYIDKKTDKSKSG